MTGKKNKILFISNNPLFEQILSKNLIASNHSLELYNGNPDWIELFPALFNFNPDIIFNDDDYLKPNTKLIIQSGTYQMTKKMVLIK